MGIILSVSQDSIGEGASRSEGAGGLEGVVVLAEVLVPLQASVS
jgi:hypothetical protein